MVSSAGMGVQEIIVATRGNGSATDLYETDLYVWAQNQAELLRDRCFDELDLPNLIEEVEHLGGALRRSVRLHAMTIVEHLLKLQHWPRSDRRLAWREAVRRQRSELLNDLTPSLRHHLAEDLSELYARARHDADGSLRDYGEHDAADALPNASPYTLDQITGDWLP
jgi:hypothetical protein